MACSSRPASLVHHCLLLASVAWSVAADAGARLSATCGGFRGDCNGDGRVSIGELQRAVNMSLGGEPAGCGADADGSGTVSGEELAAVVDSFLGNTISAKVAIFPLSALLATGQTVQLTGAVTGCGESDAVSWSVQEGAAGGSITADGLYTAPGATGTYHVVASVLADPSRTATATVAVTGVTTLAEQTLAPSPSEQTVSVPGRISVSVAGGSLSEPATVRIVEVSGVPAPPSEYTAPSAWYRVEVSGVPSTFPVTITFPGAAAGAAVAGVAARAGSAPRPVVLMYSPPAFYEVPSSADLDLAGLTAMAGQDLRTDRHGSVIGPAFSNNRPGFPYQTESFQIMYSTSGADAAPADTEYDAETDNLAAIPDFIEDVGTFLERSLTLITGDYGLRKAAIPQQRARYPVFVGNYKTSEWSAVTGFIYVANKLNSKSELGPNWHGSDRTLLQAEMAHEFMHATQNEYRTFVGMAQVKWLTESLADYVAITSSKGARELLEVKLVNFGDWFHYQYWDSSQEEMPYLGAAWLEREAGEGAFELDESFMANDYTAAYTQAGEAEHLLSAYAGWKAGYADLVRSYFFDPGSPLATQYYPQIKRNNRDALFRHQQARAANRLVYETDTATEKVFTLGAAGGLLSSGGVLSLTADVVSVAPSSTAVSPKDDTVRGFSVELKTDLGAGEEAWFQPGKSGKPVGSPEMLPPKGTAQLVRLGRKEAADCFWVLLINPNPPSAGATAHQVVVRTLHIDSVAPPKAAVGEIVTIKGSGFGTSHVGNTVTFSGKTAQVASWSDTEIRVTVPDDAPGASQVVVTVRQLPTNEVPFEVILRVSVSGKSSVVIDCTGVNAHDPQTTTFTATVTTPFRPQLSYAWTFNTSSVGGGDKLALDTTGCPYESVWGTCSACSLLGYTVAVTVTDGLQRKGIAAVNWGGAF